MLFFFCTAMGAGSYCVTLLLGNVDLADRIDNEERIDNIDG